jgi:hypothetical protein
MSSCCKSENKEDSAGDDITLDLGGPQLDLIEPQLVILGEMQVNLSISFKKGFGRLADVRRKVNSDDMDLFAALN